VNDKPMWYILNADHSVTPVNDLEEWVMKTAFDDSYNQIDWTGNDTIYVSTIFLGMDHNYRTLVKEDRPILFETMVFGGAHDGTQMRWCTYDEAVQGHKIICAAVFKLEVVGNDYRSQDTEQD
jgi:hypothetical protein